MRIKLLPDAPTEHRCDACQQMVAAGSLIDDRGRYICQQCYDSLYPVDPVEDDSLLCKDAYLAFKLAIWGIVSLGLGFVLVGLSVIGYGFFTASIMIAVNAKREMKANPELKGANLAQFAIIISIFVIVVISVVLLSYLWQYIM